MSSPSDSQANGTMARTWFRRGDTVDFTIPLTPTPAPLINITTPPTDGDTLFYISLAIRNDAAAPRTPEFTLGFVTGTSSDGLTFCPLAAAVRQTFNKLTQIEGPQPQRTWQIILTGVTDLTQVLVANRTSLLVIQLPDWQTFSIFD